MNDFVRRILSGALMLVGLGQVGCKGGPFLACLSVAEPARKDVGGGTYSGVHACLSPPLPPREAPDAAQVPQPPANPCLSMQLQPCLSVAPDSPRLHRPAGRPDASSDARRPEEPREVLASLSDRLPDDVKARLGLTPKPKS